MVSIFHVIARSHLMYQDRGPALPVECEVGIYPAFLQVPVERAELIVKVILPVDRSDDFTDRDLLHTQKSSVWTLRRRFFREDCQCCRSAHEFCPEHISSGIGT